MTENQLSRTLGFRESLALVVGTIIGTGIFLKTAVMAEKVGSPTVVLLAWALAGALSLAGALTYAELGALFPKAGGEFAYLEKSYGRLPAFLFGWMRFWIGSPGSIAAYAVGAATFLSPLFGGLSDQARTTLAIGFIFVFTLLNGLSVRSSGIVQVILTVMKVLMIAVIIYGCFFISPSIDNSFANPEGWIWPGLSAFGAATIAALWAYDGWNNLPMASGEVQDPQKNLPRALIVGTLLILLIYGLVNLAYFRVLPFETLAVAADSSNKTATSIATKAAQTFLGPEGLVFLSLAFVISALGAMHGSILTSARVPFAMARENLFFRPFGSVHAKFKTPTVALIVQGVWAIVLALSGTFDQLTDYVVFGGWIFYALCAYSVIHMRRKYPELPRAYRVPWYPFLPIVFITVALLLLANTLYTSPRESGYGLAIILAGVPVYALFFRKQQKP